MFLFKISASTPCVNFLVLSVTTLWSRVYVDESGIICGVDKSCNISGAYESCNIGDVDESCGSVLKL